LLQGCLFAFAFEFFSRKREKRQPHFSVWVPSLYLLFSIVFVLSFLSTVLMSSHGLPAVILIPCVSHCLSLSLFWSFRDRIFMPRFGRGYRYNTRLRSRLL
jgi:hypothetical protein